MINSIKILILEDSQSDAELLQRELKRSGLSFSSEITQTQDEFIAALDNFNPDIILSDYSVPSFDGLTAFHIKQKKHSEIPFIIVSGTIGEEIAVELIKNGVTDYALKDKLFSLAPKISRALMEAEARKEKWIADEILKKKNIKILEIAFLQSHQMRVPVVHILGLYSLFNFDNPSDPANAETLRMLKISAESLDIIIREIVEKITEIDAL
jgi:DNA-binding NtrC family response regulator